MATFKQPVTWPLPDITLLVEFMNKKANWCFQAFFTPRIFLLSYYIYIYSYTFNICVFMDVFIYELITNMYELLYAYFLQLLMLLLSVNHQLVDLLTHLNFPY